MVTTLPSSDAAHGWLKARGARGLVADSRRVGADDAYFAWPGATQDGRRFVGDALEAGAAACLVESDGVERFDFAAERSDRIAALAGLKANAGAIASAFLGHPSARLDVVAVTGTNGKTSTAWWTAQALGRLGRRCGTIGTLGIGSDRSELRSTGLTTPDALVLQTAFAGFVRDGYAACAVEASSIGLDDRRFDGTTVAVAVFTNLTQDHLDVHGDMATYGAAKARLFAWPGLGAAVVNVDDRFGALLAETLAKAGTPLWTTSLDGAARLTAEGIVESAEGLSFDVREAAFAGASPESRSAFIRTPQVGRYNVANVLGVVAVLRSLGVGLADAARACSSLGDVPGRMERALPATPGRPDVIVDYAHTPDALEQALVAMAPLVRVRGGKLWCVFGCGGNRDAGKRPRMGAVAARHADRVVVTSDNPRNESPEAIVAAIVAGAMSRPDAFVEAVVDRAAAIARAIGAAAPGDVVLIAGKGHETTQETAGRTVPFSDVAHARAALDARGGP